MDAGSVARFPDNVSKAIFARELSTGAPGTMVHRMRSMYKARISAAPCSLQRALSCYRSANEVYLQTARSK